MEKNKTFVWLTEITWEEWEKSMRDPFTEEQGLFELRIIHKNNRIAIIEILIGEFSFMYNAAVILGRMYRFGIYGIMFDSFGSSDTEGKAKENPIIKIRINKV